MNEPSLPKAYEPQGVEQRWYQRWEEQGWFAPSGNTSAPPYCIMIPPPNVTGSLHMGHAFQDTLMDALIRFHRMKGDNTLWQPGTDHAGIATQMVVERLLEQEGKTRHDLGRDAFIQRVWAWKNQSGGTIVRQLRRMGASCDWSRERFTMDPGLSDAVQEVFVRLYEEGLIYRGQRLVNWDPVLHTAVSDLEVLSEEEEGHMWHFRYPREDGSDYVVVATTRPETMLGDTAVAVHPEDDRYRHLVGRQVRLPLVGRLIPIVADTCVDPAFGTGCVKITPAHDFNDYETGRRHQLPMINLFTVDARLNDQAPPAYRDLDRFEARKRVVADLKHQGLLEKVVAHKLMVPRGDRSRSVIEPYLTDQWYVRVAPLAEAAIQAVEQGHIRFVPDNWTKTYFEWMRNIQDWCISRQIWWGHRIPAWHAPDGSLFVARNAEDAAAQARERLGQDVPLHQDSDVLDTWFSSALWTFSTLGWPQDTPELRTFHPTSVLVTGFDIIFFWVARMIMMGLKFTGQVPFHTVYIHGLVRDAEGHKMSKSKGNILDPLDLIDGTDLDTLVKKRTSGMMQPHLAEKIARQTRKEFPQGIPAFGTDALRFTFASLATQGRDIKFDLNRVEGYRNFCNKLWNAARFVLMNTEGQDNGQSRPLPLTELPVADRWIRSRLERVVSETTRHLDEYRFNEAANALYQFLWGEYCDWYLEMVKPVIYSRDLPDIQKSATRRVMLETLECALRLLHPLMPFITEELWQRIAPLAGRGGDTVVRAPWPTPDHASRDEAVERELAWVMDFVVAVRNIRGEMDLSPARELTVRMSGSLAMVERALSHQVLIRTLARVGELTVQENESLEGCATAVIEDMRLYLPLAGIVDIQAEATRLEKTIGKLEQELLRVNRKLGNEEFLAKASAEAVEKERTKERELVEKRQGLTEALARILSIGKLS
ncbi:MAG: valine--tRNA ligase [Magnetococcus sp. WYHC-3]